MNFDLRLAIESLDQTSIFEIANQARPAGDYLFNSILPNINMNTYDIDAGSLTIRSTMAGLTGMDSKYTEGGAAEQSVLQGRTGKMAITSVLPEKFLRDLQDLLLRLTAQNVPTAAAIQQTGMNFVDKIIVQGILDREEWLKGQALFTGALDWTFNGKHLEADYGIPAANFLTSRTGNNGYGGSTSKFWDDWWAAQEILNWQVSAVVCHPTTLKTIMANSTVNQLQFVTADSVRGIFQFARTVERGGNTIVSNDPRDFITIYAYAKEGEVWDLDNPGETVRIPFCPIGKLLFVGAPVVNSSFIVGQGSTQDPLTFTPVQIGYGHVAPTVEGGGLPGRWGRLYVPYDAPWSMAADGVENFLPVIQAPTRLVIATTETT